MSEAFDDWYDSTEIEGQALFQIVDMGIAEFIFNNVCAYQREVDAWIASEFNPNGSWGTRIAKAIREQKID